VLTLHDVIPLALPSLYFCTVRQERDYHERLQRDLECADLVVTDSESSKRDIVTRFRLDSEPVVIYPANLLPTHFKASASASVLGGGYFVYLGGYERRKGLESLVKVYRELYETRQIGTPLVLVGEPHSVSNELTDTITAGESEGAIIEKGYVPDDELAALLQGARALVYPSLYEGFGYPPLEAMAQGCPVITTRVGSMPEICGNAVRYIAAGDAAELAASILEIDRSEESRLELSRMGRERAARFTWEASAEKYLDALDNLLERKAVRCEQPF
jgi:alpha-1,3-rhamnosyl/mannosyltransferase